MSGTVFEGFHGPGYHYIYITTRLANTLAYIANSATAVSLECRESQLHQPLSRAKAHAQSESVTNIGLLQELRAHHTRGACQ